MIGFVNHGENMPAMLEVALLCEDWHISPDKFGFDLKDPRVIRNMRMVANIYHVAVSRKQASNKSEWDRDNQDSYKLLNWATKQYKGVPVKQGPNMPRMPKRTD